MQSLDHLADGIEEFVDRGADGDDHRTGRGDVGRRAREQEPVLPQRLGEKLLAAIFDEGQAPVFQRLEHLAIEVMDVDPVSGLGKRQHQRDADMAAAADDREVRRRDRRSGHRGGLGTGKIQLTTPMVSIGAW